MDGANHVDGWRRRSNVLDPLNPWNKEEQGGKKCRCAVGKPAPPLHQVSESSSEGGKRQRDRHGHQQAEHALDRQTEQPAAPKAHGQASDSNAPRRGCAVGALHRSGRRQIPWQTAEPRINPSRSSSILFTDDRHSQATWHGKQERKRGAAQRALGNHSCEERIPRSCRLPRRDVRAPCRYQAETKKEQQVQKGDKEQAERVRTANLRCAAAWWSASRPPR